MTTNGEVKQYWSVAYIASPFFTPEQIHRVSQVEDICEKHGVLGLSPRKFMVLKPHASFLERKSVFEDNVAKIKGSAIVLANIQGYDVGTLWEMGYAYALGIPVVAFNLDSVNMNVMLACGCRGFLPGVKQLEKFLTGHATKHAEINEDGKWWDYNWEEAKKWFREVY